MRLPRGDRLEFEWLADTSVAALARGSTAEIRIRRRRRIEENVDLELMIDRTGHALAALLERSS